MENAVSEIPIDSSLYQDKSLKKRLAGFFLGFLLIFLFILNLFLIWRTRQKPSVLLSPIIDNKIIFNPDDKVLSSSVEPAGIKEVIGFLPSWMAAKEVKVYPKNLTQLIYFGLAANEYGQLVLYDENNIVLPEWTYFNASFFSSLVKEAKENGVKVLMSIKCFDNEDIDKIISNSLIRTRLIGQLDNLIEENELDGINIDFEYIPDTDFPTRKYFNLFMKELATKLRTKYPDLIINIDIYANAAWRDRPYDLERIADHVDQIILMGYDFHRAVSLQAGPVAPMRSDDNKNSVVEALRALFNRVPKEKIILGLPFYGYEWQTFSKEYKSYTVANTGALATYKRVRNLLEEKQDMLDYYWNNQSMTPWLVYKENGAIKQIHYENDQSLSLKLQLAKQLQIPGIAIWALGYEGDYQEPWEIIEKYLVK